MKQSKAVCSTLTHGIRVYLFSLFLVLFLKPGITFAGYIVGFWAPPPAWQTTLPGFDSNCGYCEWANMCTSGTPITEWNCTLDCNFNLISCNEVVDYIGWVVEGCSDGTLSPPTIHNDEGLCQAAAMSADKFGPDGHSFRQYASHL
ncbi:MAG: hypothetical protein M1491_05605 [Deltaproteobacteria bacterium]|nr:hypothetical protein [Deltaproteobacteria bacterium]MCL5276389.1 hypothetical protein [Deltaproteobacteria bacterium]